MTVESSIRQLVELSKAWRSGDAQRSQDEVEKEYREVLIALLAAGWVGALGVVNEIPDERLPADYINQRSRIVDQLETELARAATGWRKSLSGSQQQKECLEAYARTMEELFRIGHWSGEPDIESQLPEALMPKVYKDYWKKELGA